MSGPIPGSPDELTAASWALRRQASAMRAHGRAVGGASAREVSGWSGTGAVTYASASGQHSRAATGSATAVDDAADTVDRFADALRRLQRDATRHLTRKDRLEDDLRLMLQDRRRHGAICSEGSVTDLSAEITEQRRLITQEGDAITRIINDHKRIRASLYTELARALPPDVRSWWTSTQDFKDTLEEGKKGIKSGAAAVGYLRALQQYKNAPPDSPARVAALRSQVKNLKQIVPEGDIAESRKNPALKKVWDSKAGKFVLRKAGPVGTLDTMYSGGKDVVTGGGYDGARGGTTRATGAGAVVGGGLILAGSATGAGTVLVATWLLWKSGNAIYDKRQVKEPHATLSPEVIRQLDQLPPRQPEASEASKAGLQQPTSRLQDIYQRQQTDAGLRPFRLTPDPDLATLRQTAVPVPAGGSSR